MASKKKLSKDSTADKFQPVRRRKRPGRHAKRVKPRNQTFFTNGVINR